MCNACKTVAGSAEAAGMSGVPEFMGKMLEVLNHAGLAMMISIGHRTGLFDSMAGAGRVTSVELAELSGLQERYVREWLAAMATGGIVEIDGSGEVDVFVLPDEHAAVLGRKGECMGHVFQWISVLGEVESGVVESFRRGGGVPYESYSRFHEVMADESAMTVVAGLEEHILPMVPGLVGKLEAGIDVLDIGCGAGRAVCELAARFPASRFVGYDLCEPVIAEARRRAADAGLKNVRFEVRDVSRLGDSGGVSAELFDVVTGFDVIHDQRDPAGTLDAVRRVLRPGGTFLMQDLRCSTRVAENIGHPLCPFFYVISTMHCMTVSLSQGGAGLGTAWGEELAVRMLGEAGFEGVTVNTLPHDIQNNWYVMTSPVARQGGCGGSGVSAA